MAGIERIRTNDDVSLQQMRLGVEKNLPSAARGDNVAMAGLFSALRPRILGYIRKGWTPYYPPIDAEDILQDTFLGVAQALPKFETQPVDAFMGFTYKVANNRLVDASRARGRDRSSSFFAPPEVTIEESFSYEPELSKILSDALAKLPTDYRDVIALTVIAGFGADEAGKILQKNAGTIRVTKNRALNKLREIIPMGNLDKFRGLI